MKIVDQLYRTFNLKETPKRIISLVPSQTELLVDLGLEDSIVGVTKFCVHPVYLRKNKAIVGGTKQIHIDKIKALNPDIILCNKEENTKKIVEACEAICNVHVSDIFNIEDSIELINQYGSIFNKEKNAYSIVNKIKKEISGFNEFLIKTQAFKTAYFIWKKPWMVAGNNTFINYLLQLNKFENVFQNKERYPEIELSKDTINKDVELVLLSSEPFPFTETHVEEVKMYYPKAKIITVDGEMFSWYGSRLIKAFEYFKSLHSSLQSILPY